MHNRFVAIINYICARAGRLINERTDSNKALRRKKKRLRWF